MTPNPAARKSEHAILHAVVRGRVQGVGFRFFVFGRARAHGVNGSVRNLPDGGVEVWAAAPRPALEALLEDLRRGPRLARVDEVATEWADAMPEATNPGDTFLILH